MQELKDVFGDVRSDGRLHSLKSFVRPNDPMVKKVATILADANDPVWASWTWVDRIANYKEEITEFWAYPIETIMAGEGDCDDTAILLCSVLRNYFPPTDVFVVVGYYFEGGQERGHAWVAVGDRILESTKSPNGMPAARYMPYIMFNDKKVISLVEWPGFIPIAGRGVLLGI